MSQSDRPVNVNVNNNFQLQYNEYKQTLESLQTKIIELGHDKDEHDIVIKTLEKTENGRKCYRMVGGALVESNVETTKPILETKRKNLDDTINKMKEELVKVATEFEKWKKDNKIQVVKQ
ncbi:prefoldin subunit 2 [Monosporozyma unispora]|nr:Cochaperone prefoldin complex subunit [Kazachstania unispora]